MKIKTILTAVIVTAFAVTAPAAPKKTTPPKPAEKKEEPKKDNTIAFAGEVVKVTASTLSLKGAEGAADQAFAFTETTKIVNGDKPAKLADIKVGNKIRGQAKKAGKGDPVVLSVNVGEEKKADPKKPTSPPKKKSD